MQIVTGLKGVKKMTSFQWVKTPKRQKLLDALDEIPEIGRKSKSEIIEWALEDFVKKHQKSNNPQTQIGMYDKESILAVPNIYEATDNIDSWKKFYNKIKRKEDYREVDIALNTIMGLHNKKFREFN